MNKYNIGQVVWRGHTSLHTTKLSCPDCQDTLKWTLTSPSGLTLEVPCRRCQYTYSSELPSLWLREHKPEVCSLTIGKVTIELGSVSSWANEPVTYMCQETGVGSGSNYRESELYTTEAEAYAAAKMEAEHLTAIERAKPDQLRAVESGSLTLRDALGQKAAHDIWEAVYHNDQLRRKLRDTLEDECDQDEKLERIDDIVREGYDAYHMSAKNNPLVRLVHAARGASNCIHTVHNGLDAALEAFAWVPEAAS